MDEALIRAAIVITMIKRTPDGVITRKDICQSDCIDGATVYVSRMFQTMRWFAIIIMCELDAQGCGSVIELGSK
jgi:hypothetical protein